MFHVILHKQTSQAAAMMSMKAEMGGLRNCAHKTAILGGSKAVQEGHATFVLASSSVPHSLDHIIIFCPMSVCPTIAHLLLCSLVRWPGTRAVAHVQRPRLVLRGSG